jgi:hypothetical protein
MAAAAVGGAATGVSNAATHFVQQAAENLPSSVSHLITHGEASRQYAESSGGQYLFGQTWRDYAKQNQQSADLMAVHVVDLAQQEAGIHLSAGERHIYTQWVLMDHIDPLQATDILAGDNNKSADESLGRLVKLMSEPKLPYDSQLQAAIASDLRPNPDFQKAAGVLASVDDWSQKPDSQTMTSIISTIHNWKSDPGASLAEDRDSTPGNPPDGPTPV